ncbi:acyl-CoA dehydrogenase [Halieaceae bacterium IMCC14734]|uniref:Acyl-CoA dehydrogenase n=1 Tax=Candidatus Litorirhabdus singularis TaxID=2518993 RepID=A0ABT3TJR3_9GAMM|nr:acyl-CoA dehydrogenase family protein [Candidatus Litorirhabdus singularis]MCX2982557.1 acyl-CoA dehydrogenase [Candidatus Litorirhabdus singularis]
MELDFSEEQERLRETVRKQCRDHASSTAVRAAETSASGYSTELWQALADTGITAMGIDPEYGGLGMGSLDSAIVHEELGRSLVSLPLLDSAGVCASLLQLCGSQALRQIWLPQIASGDTVLVPAWQEAACSPNTDHWECSAVTAAGKLQLHGEKVLVPFANSAAAVLVALRHKGALAFALVAADTLQLREQPNHADQKLFAVDFTGVEIDALAKLDAGDATATWEQAMLQTQIAVAAQAIGGASSMLQMANEYAQQRQQFGQPIGAFQSIAHYLADCATEIEGARYLVYQAAWACDQGRPYAQLAMMAKLQATAVYRRSTVTGVQVHGGMGFSADADPQLYYRRAKHLQLMYWDTDYLEQRIAAEILD